MAKNKKKKAVYDSLFDDVLIDADEIIAKIQYDALDGDFCEGGLEDQVTAADIAAADPFVAKSKTSCISETDTDNTIMANGTIFLQCETAMEEDIVIQKFEELLAEEQKSETVKSLPSEVDKVNKTIQTRKQKGIAGYGFSEIENRVIKNNHIFCHNGDLYAFNDRCYSKLNDKVLLSMITREMSLEQRNDFNFRRNRSNIMAAIKENDSIDWQINKIKPEKTIVTFKNGNLDIETGIFFGHSPNILTVYEVDANYLDGSDHLPTPKWNDYILSAVDGKKKEVMGFMNTILGYLLIPGAPAKKFFVFGTAPDSGKSVFGDFLTFLLGDENVSGVELHEFQRNFMFSAIAGKVANVAMDLPDEPVPKKAASRLKSSSGRDKIEMEKKHQNSFKLGVETKFVFGTNSSIKLTKFDKAFYNRMIVVPFMHSVSEEEQNWNLLDELKDERDYIVTKAMKSVMKLRKKNYVFPIIEASTKLHREWSRSEADIVADTVKEFATECCIKTADPLDFITAEALFGYYVDFCDIRGYKGVNRTLFPQLMEQHFPKKRASYMEDGMRSQPRGFNYIKIKAS